LKFHRAPDLVNSAPTVGGEKSERIMGASL
jgi:hypothetical protein